MRTPNFALFFLLGIGFSVSARAELLVTTIDRAEPYRGISLAADAQEITIHSTEGPVVELKTADVIEIAALPAPPSPPPATRPFEIELTDGSRLRGVPAAGPPGILTLRSRVLRDPEGKVEIPIEQLWSMRRVTGATLPPASRLVRVKDQDAAYRLNGGRVTGVIEEFRATGVVLDRGEGSTRTIPFDQLAALFVDNDRPDPPSGLQAMVRLADSSAVILRKDFRIGSGLLVGSTTTGVQVRISTDHIAALGFRGGRFAHLSDLVPVSIERKPFFPIPEGEDADALLGFLCPVRFDRSPDDRPIHLAKQRYFKGIGVRPHTELEYELGGRFRSFQAVCGIDDEVLGPGYGRGGGTGSVVFVVKLDGEVAHTSPVVRGGKKPHRVRLDVTGRKRMTLVVSLVPSAKLPGKQKDSPELDNAVWARPLLIR